MPLTSLSSKAAAKPAEVQVVGPFLGWRGPGAIRIAVGLPHRADATLRCELYEVISGKLVAAQETAPAALGEGVSALFRTFVFDFSQMETGTSIRYRFLTSALEPVSLEGGLCDDHCRFQVPDAGDAETSFVLMSCHNPFMIRKGAADEGWAMWRELGTAIEQDTRIRLLVLGGDQVYNDDLEDEGCIARLSKKPDDPVLHDEVRKRLIRQYQLFWGNLAYRKVLARIPSVAMWDDHDITDGWGGRPEAWKGTDWEPGWHKYFELCREAFQAYQDIRNPPAPARFKNLPGQVFTFTFDFAGSRFLLLDLRSEKNLDQRRIVSPEHAEAIHSEIRETPANCRRLFVLSPVVPLRTNFDDDRRLSLLTKTWLGAQLWMAHTPASQLIVKVGAYLGWLFPLLCGTWMPDGTALRNGMALASTGGALLLWLLFVALHWAEYFTLLPQLTDDLEDGLSTDANRPELQRLLESIVALKQNQGVDSVILSGDIHAAGMTEIIHRAGTELTLIPQIVASPVAYEPMPKMVEGYTTTTSEMVFWDSDESSLLARNIFYVSKRNFAVVRTNRSSTDRPVEFHLEGHRLPIAFNLDFRAKG